MEKNFYITIPAFFINSNIHIWNAYSAIIADFIARYKRILGYDVKFSAWTDENSHNIVSRAKNINISTEDYIEMMRIRHKKTWHDLDITYTDFINTSSPEHSKVTTSFLEKIKKSDDLYKSIYEGYYCEHCNKFRTSQQLTKEGLCPEDYSKPQLIQEENYFFKLSKYKDTLLDFYKKNPNFILPKHRLKEIQNFFNKKLKDISISRKKNWIWITIPFDTEQISYQGFDCLLNYLTACKDRDIHFWPPDIHVVGKDITKIHAIQRPAFCFSAWLKPPKQIISTWFYTIENQPISRNKGYFIDPSDLVHKYWNDLVRFYLLYDSEVWEDSDFSFERFRQMYQSMLIGGWGNLVYRVSKLVSQQNIDKWKLHEKQMKNFSKSLEKIKKNNKLAYIFINGFEQEHIEYYLENGKISWYTKDWFTLVQTTNKYLNQTKPWKWKKHSELEFLVFMIKNLGLLSAPLLPEWFEKLKNSLNTNILDQIDWKKTINNIHQIFDTKEFKINIKPTLLYKPLE